MNTEQKDPCQFLRDDDCIGHIYSNKIYKCREAQRKGLCPFIENSEYVVCYIDGKICKYDGHCCDEPNC
jgi:hypothetical protein